MRILVVDDDPVAGEMSLAVLEGLGHEVEWVENGLDALRALDTGGEFAMIISDMNMPLLSGIDLFRELRERGDDRPFILLTGDDPEGPLAKEPRLDGCITKDFTLEESLSRVIDEVRARRREL
ncbi:Response regulator MprA [Candidatus Magnetaquicoccaceae bacterium FCR-1]|uniref:Response regulator MprA n=1 Tax=Candidatus Magnetaquiglobus chichijimensis TaxID=3141448 RepID=A0ABQ0C8G3_9PROT